MLWDRSARGWLLELGAFYVHWNAPPCPSLWVGWLGCWQVMVLVAWGADA